MGNGTRSNGGLRAGACWVAPIAGNDGRVVACAQSRQLICHDSLNFERTNHNDKPNDNNNNNSRTQTKVGTIHLSHSAAGLPVLTAPGESGETDGSSSLLSRLPLLLATTGNWYGQAYERKYYWPGALLPMSAAATSLRLARRATQWKQQCYSNTAVAAAIHGGCGPLSSWSSPSWRAAGVGNGRQQVSASRRSRQARLQARCYRPLHSYLACVTLLLTTIATLQLFVAVPAVEGYLASNVLARQDIGLSSSSWSSSSSVDSGRPVFNDPSCARVADSHSDQAHWLLLVLKCDLKPLVETFERLLSVSSSAAAAATSTSSNAELAELRNRLTLMAKSIEPFYEEAMFIFSRKDFCTYPVVERFGRLKELGHDLLGSVYDVLAIDFHKSCLASAISRLPQVPYLVRNVVDIYMGDAASALPDLNSKPKVFSELAEEMDQFDVGEALARNGPLEQVIELVLMPGLGSSVQSFKDKCKQFLIEIDHSWQSMEMMSRLLSTDTNGIQRFNNFVMRQLERTKYADICSQLSNSS